MNVLIRLSKNCSFAEHIEASDVSALSPLQSHKTENRNVKLKSDDKGIRQSSFLCVMGRFTFNNLRSEMKEQYPEATTLNSRLRKPYVDQSNG